MNALRAMGRHCWTWGLAAALATGASTGAWAQQNGGGGAAARSQPRSVLLFPAVVGAPEGAAATAEPTRAVRQIQESVTDALRKHFARNGIAATVYTRRLPSIQRAVAEGTLTAEVAATGLRDTADNARAQRLAETIGANSFVTATIDDYRYDAATRAVTFNLSVSHIAAGEDGTLGTAAAPGRGEAPADVAGSLQEGSAGARAAEAAAEQAVQGLFPRAPEPNPAQKKQTQTQGRRGVGRDANYALYAFAALFAAIATR